MRYLFTLAVLSIFVVGGLHAQAKKPTIMVVPSDNWCKENGYMLEFETLGGTKSTPDYRAALQGNSDLLLVIAKINELMTTRGFPLKNLESSLKKLETKAAEDEMTMSKGGASLNSSPLDALKMVAKADIWMQMTWTVNQVGPKKSITFILTGLDAYTDKQIAGASGTGEPSFTAELPILLEECVLNHLDNFNNQLMDHFNDMVANGREVAMEIKTWDTWEYDLEEELGDDELQYEIEDWVYENTVNGVFSLMDASEYSMEFEQIRIPLYNEDGRAIDAKRWAKGLKDFLEDEREVPAKVSLVGLGKVRVILGEQ